MTRSATNNRNNIRKVLAGKRARTCKNQRGGKQPLSSLLGTTHTIECKIVEKGQGSSGDGVKFSPGKATEGMNMATIKQLLVNDKDFMSRIKPQASAQAAEKLSKEETTLVAKKDVIVKDLGKTGRYTVPYTKDPGAQMQIIRSFEDKFFSEKKGYIFQRRYSGNSIAISSKSRYAKEEPNKGSYFMRLITLLFMMKIFKTELDKHEKKEFGVSDQNNAIQGMNIVHSSLPSYSGKRFTFTPFYSLLAPLNKDYSNATPIYEDLENLFSTDNEWINSAKGLPYMPLIEIINDPFFNDVYNDKKDAKEKAKVFKYKLLLFISYYNKIINEEGKSVGSYDGERKIINDMKYALIGDRGYYQGDTSKFRANRGTQLTDALHHMMDGLKKMNAGLDSMNNSIITYSGDTIAINTTDNKNFTEITEKINAVTTQNIETNENLPFSGKKNSKEKIEITNLQSGGAVNNEAGPIYVLGTLVEGHAVLQKGIIGQEKDYNLSVIKTDPSLNEMISKLENKEKTKQLSEVLKLYIKKYFDIVTKVYYPAILTGKSSVGIYEARGDKGGEDYVRARVRINHVQADLLVLNTYLSRISMPDENEIPDNQDDIGYTSADLKKIFEKYGVTGDVLKVTPSQGAVADAAAPFAITKEQVARLFTEKDNFAEEYETLRKDINTKIIEEYNTAFRKYNEESNKLDTDLNGTNEGLKQFLESKNFRTRLENNNSEINGLHNYFLNEQSRQAGGDSAAAAASPADAASSADAASPADAASSAVGRPKYQPLTEEKIMLPKKLPDNIGELLKAKTDYIGIKNDEPIDLTKQAISFSRKQIESLQKAVQENSPTKDSSKGSKQLIEQKVLISTYGGALEKMEKYVEELTTQLEQQNKLTNTLLKQVFDELNKKISELKGLLDNKKEDKTEDEIKTVKDKFKNLVELWRTIIGPFRDKQEDKAMNSIALFKYHFLKTPTVDIPDNSNLKNIEDVINKQEGEEGEVSLSFFMNYKGSEAGAGDAADPKKKYDENFTQSIGKFEKEVESKVVTLSSDIIAGNEPNIKTLTDEYKTQVLNPIINIINEETTNLSDDTLTHIKDKLFNFPNMGAFNTELKEGVDKANTALQAKLQKEQENKAKATALVKSATEVKKITELVNELVNKMSSKNQFVKKLVKLLIAYVKMEDNKNIDITEDSLTKILDSFIGDDGCPKQDINDGVAKVVEKQIPPFVLVPEKDNDIKESSPIFGYFTITCQDEGKDTEITDFLKNLRDSVKESYKDQVKEGTDFANELDAAEKEKTRLETEKTRLETEIEEKQREIQQKHIEIQEAVTRIAGEELGLESLAKNVNDTAEKLIPVTKKTRELEAEIMKLEMKKEQLEKKISEEESKQYKEGTSKQTKSAIMVQRAQRGHAARNKLRQKQQEKLAEMAELERKLDELRNKQDVERERLDEIRKNKNDHEDEFYEKTLREKVNKELVGILKNPLSDTDNVNKGKDLLGELRWQDVADDVAQLDSEYKDTKKYKTRSDDFTNQISAIEGEMENRRQEIERLIQEIEQKKSRFGQQTESGVFFGGSNGVNDGAASIIQRGVIAVLDKRIEDEQKTISETIQNLKSKLDNINNILNTKKVEYNTLKKEEAKIRAENTKFNDDLKRKIQELEDLNGKKEIVNLLKEVKKLEKENTGKNTELQNIIKDSLPAAEKKYLSLKDKKEAFEKGVSVSKYKTEKLLLVALVASKLKSKVQSAKSERVASKAASKIQAVQRGKKVREEQATKAEAESLIKQTKAATKQTKAATKQTKAATKIQAVVKGSKVRGTNTTQKKQGERIGQFLQEMDINGGKKMRKAIKKALGKSTMKKRPANKKKSEKKKPKKKYTMNRRIWIRKGTLKK